MKKILFAIATVAMLFATSCKDENKFNEPVAPKDPSDIPANSFYCEIDNNANPQNAPTVSNGKTTMAYLDGKHVMWQPGDAINVNGTDFINSSSENQAAYFENKDASPFQQLEYEAYYPASLYNNNNHSYELPAVVTIDPDRNASHLPMYAYSTDHWLTFHNLCAAMKINVPMACSRIVIVANGTAICGNFTVEGKGTTAPYAQIDGTGCDSIVIYKKATTGGGNQNFAIGDTAFVAIPAGTYTFTIKLYEGNTLIHEKTAENTLTCVRNKVYNITTETDFFCFEALQDGSTVKFSHGSLQSGLEYIVNGQNSWHPYTINEDITLAKAGDKVYFRATTPRNRICPIKAGGSGQLKVKGNIMYLLYGINLSNTLPPFGGQFGAFQELFYGFGSLIDASELILPATALEKQCYMDMFVSCSNMTKAPSKLPATVLAEDCYRGMFNSCSRITSAPELPARILVNNCYRVMFQNCSAIHSLTIKADQGMNATSPLLNILQGAGALAPLGGKVHCTNDALSTVEANLPTNVTGWTAVADVTE